MGVRVDWEKNHCKCVQKKARTLKKRGWLSQGALLERAGWNNEPREKGKGQKQQKKPPTGTNENAEGRTLETRGGIASNGPIEIQKPNLRTIHFGGGRKYKGGGKSRATKRKETFPRTRKESDSLTNQRVQEKIKGVSNIRHCSLKKPTPLCLKSRESRHKKGVLQFPPNRGTINPTRIT